MTRKKIIYLSTGGTGGHLFPALACADELLQLAPDIEIYLIGGGIKGVKGPLSPLYSYLQVPCGSLSIRHPLKSLWGMLAIGRGTYHAYSALRMKRPDALVGFGSYFSLPPLLAAHLMNIPLFLHAADAIPGRVIRHFSRHARCTFIQFSEAAHEIQGISRHVKMALRPHMRKGLYSRQEAADLLGVRADLPTLLVFGGSQGAKRLNEVLHTALEKDFSNMTRMSPTPMQILHYTGDESMVLPLQQLYARKGHHSLVKSYETRMDLAWTLADSAITRAGASTLAELIEYEVPTLLIPYPHAADQHQEKNARALMDALAGQQKSQQVDQQAGQVGQVSQMGQTGVEMRVEKELTSEFVQGYIQRTVYGVYGSECRSKSSSNRREALALYKSKQPQETMAQLLVGQLCKNF